MDASDFEGDVWLQKNSADLLADLCTSIPKLLHKPEAHSPRKLRYRVRVREVSRLDQQVLDRFLELPQLLDPHLAELIPQLSSAYLEYLQTRGQQLPLKTKSHLITPLPCAIAQLLYTFCKIRGEKVIIRFLNVETRYLELLLSTLETDFQAAEDPTTVTVTGDRWTWQERYVILIWLSQLLFAPFDLATISSVDLEDLTVPMIPNFEWPESLPGIAVRLIPLAVKYIGSASKERDGAKVLLVRMSMRRDMQQLGVLQALVDWALKSLELPADAPVPSVYYCIGRIAYLAGVLRASIDTSNLDQYLPRIFTVIYNLTTRPTSVGTAVMGSSVARKLIIKILRSVTVLILCRDSIDDDAMESVETCISFFMERLGDNDTPVRLAASKALSIIALRLDPDMAAQVVDAILEALSEKVLWIPNPSNPKAPKTRDMSAVDPLEWHGLTLTLGHLLYRRSPPASQLADIIHALLLGLSFEQRGPTGASIGTNVRDAACFGIWAISRRYTTAELLAVPAESVLPASASSASHATKPPSILQVLATDLIVTASRDPAGNIRRGSSAALQELIGRHPDTIVQGISVVQTVDYSAVALRSRAIHQVALAATRVSRSYGEALRGTLLTWRGIGDADAAARRVTGKSFGMLTRELAGMGKEVGPVGTFREGVRMVLREVESLQGRQAEERHGLVLCLVALLDEVPALAELVAGTGKPEEEAEMKKFIERLFEDVVDFLDKLRLGTYRRGELLAESVSRLVVSVLPLIQSLLLADSKLLLFAGNAILKPRHAARTGAFVSVLNAIRADSTTEKPILATVTRLSAIISDVLPAWLDFDDAETVNAVASAAIVHLMLAPSDQRLTIISKWAGTLRVKKVRSGLGLGFFFAVAMAFPVSSVLMGPSGPETSGIVGAILTRWQTDKDVESHVAILKALSESETLGVAPLTFLGVIREGLSDYTTNARGDIGSLVRVAALRAVKRLWRRGVEEGKKEDEGWLKKSVRELYPTVLRLAAEKLDRVRAEAFQTLGLLIKKSHHTSFSALSFSSQQYFHFLLNLPTSPQHLHPLVAATATESPDLCMTSLLSGLVTSAETGNELLVVNARAALLSAIATPPTISINHKALSSIATTLFANVKAYQGIDRVLISSLEIIAFLMNSMILYQCADVDAKSLALQAQKAAYKSGNMRKIEACIKVYGALARMPEDAKMSRVTEGRAEARKRLGALWFHPWPKVRNLVVDEVWAVLEDDQGMEMETKGKEVMLRVNWGAASKEDIQRVTEMLGFCEHNNPYL